MVGVPVMPKPAIDSGLSTTRDAAAGKMPVIPNVAASTDVPPGPSIAASGLLPPPPPPATRVVAARACPTSRTRGIINAGAGEQWRCHARRGAAARLAGGGAQARRVRIGTHVPNRSPDGRARRLLRRAATLAV